jgi:hypothetical protein
MGDERKCAVPPYGNSGELPLRRLIMTYALWIVQGLLALLFLFAGGMKLVLPLESEARGR